MSLGLLFSHNKHQNYIFLAGQLTELQITMLSKKYRPRKASITCFHSCMESGRKYKDMKVEETTKEGD
jgi:hypothetical protein